VLDEPIQQGHQATPGYFSTTLAWNYYYDNYHQREIPCEYRHRTNALIADARTTTLISTPSLHVTSVLINPFTTRLNPNQGNQSHRLSPQPPAA
jgi:hypothetical protein